MTFGDCSGYGGDIGHGHSGPVDAGHGHHQDHTNESDDNFLDDVVVGYTVQDAENRRRSNLTPGEREEQRRRDEDAQIIAAVVGGWGCFVGVVTGILALVLH